MILQGTGWGRESLSTRYLFNRLKEGWNSLDCCWSTFLCFHPYLPIPNHCDICLSACLQIIRAAPEISSLMLILLGFTWFTRVVQVDKYGLPARFKTWINQRSILPEILWPVLVYTVPNTTVESLESFSRSDWHRFMRKPSNHVTPDNHFNSLLQHLKDEEDK